MRRMLIVAAALSPVICAGQAAQSKTITLAPYTPWNVDYGDKICSLRRGFGSREKPGVLIIDRFGSTDDFRLTIIDDRLSALADNTPLTLRFGNGDKSRPLAHLTETEQGGHAVIIEATSLGGAYLKSGNDLVWPKTTPTQAAKISSLTLNINGRTLSFDTGPLDKPFSALKKCTDDEVQSWGVDAAQQATLSRALSVGNYPGAWVTDADYPPALKRTKAQASVRFRLIVDAQGKPTSCIIIETYGAEGLNEITCALLMRRANFKPALDSTGKPVSSYYINRIVWVPPL